MITSASLLIWMDPNILLATPSEDSSTDKRFKEDLIKHEGFEENTQKKIKQAATEQQEFNYHDITHLH